MSWEDIHISLPFSEGQIPVYLYNFRDILKSNSHTQQKRAITKQTKLLLEAAEMTSFPQEAFTKFPREILVSQASQVSLTVHL